VTSENDLGGGMRTRQLPLFIMCGFRTEPGETECWSATWSEGRACRSCGVECYRRGWDKARVDRDNVARCKHALVGGNANGVLRNSRDGCGS